MNLSGQLQTIHIRQLGVQQDHVQAVEPGCLESALAVQRSDTLSLKALHQMLEDPADVRVVVHDEDDPIQEAHRCTFFAGDSDGSFTVKVLPFPLWLATLMEPLC